MLCTSRLCKKTVSLTYYTILHCFVDFCCIYYMVQVVMPTCWEIGMENWLLYGVLYNFIAFAGQLPVGIFGDWLQRNSYMVAVGLLCLLSVYMGIGFGLPLLPAVLLLGIGNACFHVGGGREAMAYRENACQPVGIFVATGAFGVFGGNWVAGHGMNWLPAMAVVLGIALLLQLILCYKTTVKNQVKQTISFHPEKGSWSLLLAVCCILVVVLRSFAGTVFHFPWSSGWLALLMTVGIVLGKAVGGILADRFGIRPTVLVSLSCSALLFLGANAIPVVGLLAVFLFNMTMPITLSLLGTQFPAAKGTAFGALTFAIFIGLIPSYFCNTYQFSRSWISLLLSAASLILLYVPLWLEKRQDCAVKS
ncbi:MAG: hypothetical protein Q4D37_04415 [Oscillospiraceae bacterium]|nr:hypothetical protein [Oscillospiraceae bacterium]